MTEPASLTDVGPPTAGTAPAAAGRPNQREHILDAALRLMSEQGAGSTSMRQLAGACGLNVAAIYHYFPSKADILRSVIEERQYALQLQDLPVADVDLPPQRLLSSLIVEIWIGARREEQIWRLLLGESLRGDETSLAVGRELLDTIDQALQGWLDQLFPELGDRVEPAAAVIMGQLYAAFMETLFRPREEGEDWLADVQRRAETIAELVFAGDS